MGTASIRRVNGIDFSEPGTISTRKMYRLTLVFTLHLLAASLCTGEEVSDTLTKLKISSLTIRKLREKRELESHVVNRGKKLNEGLEARDGQKVKVVFNVSEQTESGDLLPFLPHQAFVIFTSRKTKRDTFFLAKPAEQSTATSTQHVATIDLSKEAGRLNGISGDHDMSLMVGDKRLLAGAKWAFGTVSLSLPTVKNADSNTVNHVYGKPLPGSADSSSKLEDILVGRHSPVDGSATPWSYLFVLLHVLAAILVRSRAVVNTVAMKASPGEKASSGDGVHRSRTGIHASSSVTSSERTQRKSSDKPAEEWEKMAAEGDAQFAEEEKPVDDLNDFEKEAEICGELLGISEGDLTGCEMDDLIELTMKFKTQFRMSDALKYEFLATSKFLELHEGNLSKMQIDDVKGIFLGVQKALEQKCRSEYKD